MPPVVVVGAGPTGLTAALLLARRGREVVLVERFTEPYRLPRAVHLDDEVHRILQSLGLGDAFAAVSRPALGLRLLDARHDVLAEFPRRARGEHGWPQANMFDQPELEGLLRASLLEEPGVRWLIGHELVALDQPECEPGAARVRATVHDRASGRVEVVEGSALLGCDGAGSTVRSLLGARLRDLRFTEQWLVVDVRSAEPLDVWDGVLQVCDPARAVTVMPVGPGRYRFELRLADGEAADDLARPERLLPLLAPWCGDVPAAQLDVVRAAAYTFRARVADRWQDRRVLLLGDAAHQTPPFVGQGLGAGLRDAANLAWKLDRVLAGADDALLATYQAERVPHVLHAIGTAVAVGWAMTGGADRAAALRRTVLRGVVRVPGFTTSPVATRPPRLRRGPLVVRRRGAIPSLAGRPVPQPWVSVDGCRRRLDDVLGDGFGVLSDGPASAGLQEVAHRVHAPVVEMSAPGSATLGGTGAWSVEDEDGTLTSWLRKGRARGVVVRPDRVVLDVDARRDRTDGGALLARATAGWLTLLEPSVSAAGAVPVPAAPGHPDLGPGRG